MPPASSKQLERGLEDPVASPRRTTLHACVLTLVIVNDVHRVSHSSNSSRVGTAPFERDSVLLPKQPSLAGTILPERNSVTLPEQTSPVERNSVTSPGQPSYAGTPLSERNPITSPRQLATPHVCISAFELFSHVF